MKPFTRRGAGLGAAIALVVGLALTSAPAQAAPANLKAVDITGYKISDIVVSNKNCKTPSVKASIKKKTSTVTDFTSDVYLTRNGKKINYGIANLRDLTADFYFCPSRHGLGKYTVGPAKSEAEYTYKQDGTTYVESVKYIDNTKKDFYVRGAVKNSLTAKRQGSKVTLSTTASVYAPEKDRYAQYNPKNAKLQVKSGKNWKTIKTLKLSNGKASITLKDSGKKTYRVSIPQSSYAVAKVSGSVSK